MDFFLLTDEYDSMHGSFQTGYETEFRPLMSKTFEDACDEARLLFVSLPKYHARAWNSEQLEYPCNPRLVARL